MGSGIGLGLGLGLAWVRLGLGLGLRRRLMLGRVVKRAAHLLSARTVLGTHRSDGLLRAGWPELG